MHDLHSKSESAIGDRVPIAKDLSRSRSLGRRRYENCELPLAISRVRGVLRAVGKKEKRKGIKRKKREREREGIGAITRSGNFVRRPLRGQKSVLQRGRLRDG